MHLTCPQADSNVVEQLRADIEGLIAKLSDLSQRNAELTTSKESDLIVIHDLDAQLKDHKRKYDHAKTELHSVKGRYVPFFFSSLPSHILPTSTSALFKQNPKFDDQLPFSADGAIPDVHLMAFLTAIDTLLSASRCVTADPRSTHTSFCQHDPFRHGSRQLKYHPHASPMHRLARRTRTTLRAICASPHALYTHQLVHDTHNLMHNLMCCTPNNTEAWNTSVTASKQKDNASHIYSSAVVVVQYYYYYQGVSPWDSVLHGLGLGG